jgi:hypothetical protein
MKTREELVKFMWQEYPNEESLKQQDCRTAMLKAYDFISGKIDQNKKEKAAIAERIFTKLMKDHEI